MTSLLNKNRPPVFCPGCSHERILHALDKAFQRMGLEGNQIAIVSDIGCSGLFDTFFDTHALHGLHGRAAHIRHRLKDGPAGPSCRGDNGGRRRGDWRGASACSLSEKSESDPPHS